MLEIIRTGLSRRVITAVALVIGVTALSACETIQGFGRDVQSGGESLEGASEDVQRDM